MGVFTYYDPDTEGTVYHVIPDPGSEYAPSTFYSETDSTASGSTIRSDDLPGYFVLHNGRQRSASENIAKWFPSDNVRRYVIRYFIIRSIFGGDYVGPVKEMLSPLEKRARRVLELGTKAGTWIQAMSTEFPHVQFRTVDVAPMVPHTPRHNVTFEVYDFTEGVLLEDESQDAVFLNYVLEVKNYRGLLREAYRVLRPGGLIYVVDFNPGLWDPEDLTVLVQRKGSQTHRDSRTVRQGLINSGVDPDTCDKLPQWLAPGSDLWNEGQHGFKDIYSDMRPWPFYPHHGHSCMKRIDPSIAPYIRHFTTATIRDMVGLVKDTGLTHEEATKLADDTLEELKQPENCDVCKVYSIYATKT